MSRFITGTVAQLSGKLTLNGQPLGQPELSVFTRLCAGKQFKQVGIIKHEGARGRPSIIWQVDTETAAWFEVADATGLNASDTDAPEYVAPVKAAAAA